jgi:large subunit ribosomal protein L6
VQGPKGESRVPVFQDVIVKQEGNELICEPSNPTAETKARHGLLRSLLQNAIIGVSEGFMRELEVQGVGFRVSLAGKALKLHLGFSHELTFEIPEGIEVAVDGLKITVTGHDKQLVGQTAANIRKLKKPEPYKGKGIRYADEYVIRKAGKTAA